MFYGMGYPGYYGYFDWTYVLVLIGALLSIGASAHINSVFSRYSAVRGSREITGAQTADTLLRYAGIYGVGINRVRGSLTDNYNPRQQSVNLSEPIYASTSIAAVSVAAHECGHAMQHSENYFPLAIRSALVPAANIGSRIGIPIILVGLFLSSGTFGDKLVTIGIWCFALSVLFQLVTLPVEFDASRRALAAIKENSLLDENEYYGAKKVLTAAALTYVASAAASILSLLRLVILFGGGRNRRD
ncbi:MAG: zinc metallopeptidase [Lachnospiraceae bacterium]|nr:zinc metallopeptidase [Lachnospiraceae bacterium]